MMKSVVLCMGFIFVVMAAAAQKFTRTTELGLNGGISYYTGELNTTHYTNIHPAGGFFFRRNWNRRWFTKIGANFARVSGADSLQSHPMQQNRNLSFRSNVYEAFVQMEFSYFPFDYNLRHGYKYTPYLFMGIGAMVFNPQAEHAGSWYDLQPLGTEGQNINSPETPAQYKLTGVTLPMGIGFRIRLGGLVAIGLEVGFRYTYTDYLDDVSGKYANQALLETGDNNLTPIFADRSLQKSLPDGTNSGLDRGNPAQKDFVFISGFQLTFNLSKKRIICPAWN